MTRSFWRLLAAPLLIAFVILSPAAAMAQTYGPGPTVSCTVNISITTVGGQITITCTGFSFNETITFTFESAPVVLGTAVADANGTVSMTFRVPSDATLGVHHVVATGSSGRVASSAITVVAPTVAGTPTPSGIAFTGANALRATGVGAAIIGGGGLLVLVSRKRRRRGVEA